MRSYGKILTLLKVCLMLILTLTFFACPQSKSPDSNPDKPSGLPDIVGSEKANENLKGTAWVYSQAMGGGNGSMEVSRLEFDSETNLCKIRVLINNGINFYLAEYSLKDDKINLKLDQNIKALKNYTGEQMIKDMEADFEKEIKDIEGQIADPNIPEELKSIMKKTLNAMKKAVKEGMFTSIEKFKKLMLEIVIPAQIEQLEAMLKDTSLPPEVRTSMQNDLDTLKAIQKNPSLITQEFEKQVAESKKTANYLQSINPIILTLPQGKTLATATTMTANKIYLGLDNNDKPEYKENVEFNEQ